MDSKMTEQPQENQMEYLSFEGLSLAGRLGLIENSNKVFEGAFSKLRQDTENFNRSIEKYRNLGLIGYDFQEIKPEEMPERVLEIDVKETQRRVVASMLEQEEPNPILIQAVEREKTITGSLEELAYFNKGWRIWIPHRKNEEHNRRVYQMQDLIGGPIQGILERKGILSSSPLRDGALGFLSFGSIFGVIAYYMAFSFSSTPPASAEKLLAEKLIGITVLGSGGLGGWAASNSILFKRLYEILPWDNAKYLDDTLPELRIK